MAGLYIHIPFCSQKCIYCDFYSVSVKDNADEYVKALVKELNLRMGELNGEHIDTVYLGGGTPSLLTHKQLDYLIKNIANVCDMGKVTEFTMEVNPDDIAPEYAKGLYDMGINRISMGVQSFNDDELTTIKRRHNSAQAIDAINHLKGAGFSNISIDIIYGLPGQTVESWQNTVKEAINSNVFHISAYSLTYEEGTLIYKMRERGDMKEVPENTYVDFYNILTGELSKAGFEHYEISNFSLPGKYSRHNCSYWNSTPYLGLGTSAHSFDGKTRRFNPNGIREYIRIINGGNTFYREEEETVYEIYNDYVMTRLRTMWGLDINELENRFGDKLVLYFKKNAEKYIQSGNIIIEGNIIKISPEGIMLSDFIFRDIFYV